MEQLRDLIKRKYSTFQNLFSFILIFSFLRSSNEDYPDMADTETKQLMKTLKTYITKYHQDGAAGINHIKLYKPYKDLDMKAKNAPQSPYFPNEYYLYKMHNLYSGFKK